MHATSARVVFPLPLGIAVAKSPPLSTDSSICAMTFRWSSDHSSVKVWGKYASQKARKPPAEADFRASSATGGISPMSRPEADIVSWRRPARALRSSYVAVVISKESNEYYERR